jgi:(2Fe-2S) ferredoxin
MENKLQKPEEKNYNIMGSEVVSGFACKPKKLDPEKPIMHFKTQIFLCHDERCAKAHKSEHLAADLRDILKEMNLARGENRIKISRTGCFGACRFRSVANIYENTRVNGHANNNNLWIRNVHKFDEQRWKELFTALSTSKDIDDSDFEQIPMSEPKLYK